MKFVICLLLLSVFFGASLQDENPGFKTTITQNGLTYAKNVGIELLEQLLSTLTIPDQSGDVSPGISWWLTDLKLTGVSLPSSSATLIPNQGVQLQISGVGATLNFNWRYRQDGWPHISDSGDGYVAISNSDATVQIHLYAANGRPACNVISDNVDLNNLDIHVNGGPSWLYNLLIGLFEGDLKNAITGALQNAITNGVNNGLNGLFGQIPLKVPISPTTEIDFSIVSTLDFSSNYFMLPDSGEFYARANPVECPATRFPLPDTIDSQMVQMIIGDYVATSAGYVYWKLGQLAVNITDKMLPSWSPIRLNTSSFEYVLPELYQKYPNAEMVVELSVGEMPIGTFKPSGALVQAYGFMTVYVIEGNSYVTAFVLNGTAEASGIAWLKGTTLIGNLTFLDVDFALYQSNIGPFDVTILDKLLNTLFNYGIIPGINIYLAEGFPLPVVPGLTFVNPSLGYGNQYLYVTTDVTYVPPQPVASSPSLFSFSHSAPFFSKPKLVKLN